MKNLLCPSTNSILQALKRLEKSGTRILFVVNHNKKLIGVLTDGDVRRALIAHTPLTSPVAKIMTKEVRFARASESQDDMVRKLTSSIKTLPVVNDAMHVIDYIQFDKDIHLPVASPSLRGNELTYLLDAFLSTWISSSGKYIEQFEKAFARFCGCRYAVAVSNGTTALHLALTTLGIGSGDEVIVPDLTFAATINAVLHAQARPVIVDIEPSYWTINPREIERAITKRTKAIIPVHVYGQPCDMAAIGKIAKRHNLFVIEDCAEAHGAHYRSRMVGSFGAINCFSFFGNKIITTGEGGMCVTNSRSLYDRLRLLRNQGMSHTKKYWHSAVGYNYRMTNLQAAIGLAQLERVRDFLKKRQALEDLYRKIFHRDPSLSFQETTSERKKITWLVSALARTPNERDRIIELLKKHKVDARPFFYSLSTMPIYRKYSFSSLVSKAISARGINLPTTLDMVRDEILFIRNILRNEL